MVDIKGVFKSYHQKKVIDDVSLYIPKGKITSFIGPNGAGKSTLISMISRLIAKGEGIITIDGKDITEVKDEKLARKISIFKQSNTTNVQFTIIDLVSFGRIPYCKGTLKKEDKQIVHQASRYTALEYMQDKYLDQLSGGQPQ